MADTRTVTIKIGGRPATNDAVQRLFARELASLRGRYRFIVVHGGGAEVTRVSRAFGLEPVFRDGIRMTTPAEMDIVDMVLAGKVNKEIVRRFGSEGVPAFGMCGADGNLFTGKAVGDPEENRTANVATVDTRAVSTLLDAGFVPVIASVSMDGKGRGMNINADEAALDIAVTLKSDTLIYVSDIPGIMKDGAVLPDLDEPAIEAEIATGTISGGMIPKARSSVQAVKRGVRQIVIGEYNGSGDLEKLIEGGLGTHINP